jgi:hypothetical protein
MCFHRECEETLALDCHLVLKSEVAKVVKRFGLPDVRSSIKKD